MSARVLGLPEPEAGPLDGPSPCSLIERETCTGRVRGFPEEGPPACSGPAAGAEPDSGRRIPDGRGNPDGLEPIPVRAYM